MQSYMQKWCADNRQELVILPKEFIIICGFVGKSLFLWSKKKRILTS